MIMEDEFLVFLSNLGFCKSIGLHNIAEVNNVGVDLEVENLMVGISSNELTTKILLYRFLHFIQVVVNVLSLLFGYWHLYRLWCHFVHVFQILILVFGWFQCLAGQLLELTGRHNIVDEQHEVFVVGDKLDTARFSPTTELQKLISSKIDESGWDIAMSDLQI